MLGRIGAESIMIFRIDMSLAFEGEHPRHRRLQEGRTDVRRDARA